MEDYSNHKYSRLLTYLQNGCEQYREENDFSQYLIPMEGASSVEALIVIYNNFYFMLAYFILHGGKMPQKWYQICTLGIGNEYLFRDLSNYFNENIVRLFKECTNPTIEQRQFFLANMRQSEDVVRFHNEIVANTEGEARETLRTIIHARRLQYEYRMKLEKDYRIKKTSLNEYKNNTSILLKYHRICDIAELRFGRDFDIVYKSDILRAEYEKYMQQMKPKESEEQDPALSYSYSGMPGWAEDIGDALLSAALAIPFGIIGGAIGAAFKGRGRRW